MMRILDRWMIAVALGATLTGCEAAEPAPAPAPAARQTVSLEVAWPEASDLDREGFAALSARSQGAVLRSEIPVLIPTDAIESAIVMARPAWTAVSARRDGLTISLHATRVEHAYADIAPAKGPHTVRDQPAFITQNEGIWSASWKEYGAHYALEVECDDPSEARCADDAHLRALAKTLRYVGGKLHAAQLEGGR